MTLDEYNAQISRIFADLQQIADRTANQAWLGVANTSNPVFVEIMLRHEQLTKLSSELTERMINELKR